MVMTSSATLLDKGGLPSVFLGSNGDITGLRGGGYAVVAELAGSGSSVLSIFNESGEQVRSFVVEGTSPTITGLDGGGIAVTTLQGGNAVVKVVSNDLQKIKVGAVTDVGPSITNIKVAAGEDGSFVMVQELDFGTDKDTRLEFFDKDGQSTAFVDVENDSGTDSRDPDVAVLANGNIVVTRTEHDPVTGTRVAYSIYDSQGNEVVPRTLIENSPIVDDEDGHGRVVATANGFAIAYETRYSNNLSLDIALGFFDLNGAQIFGVPVSTDYFATGSDDGFRDTAPEIAVSEDGSIAVTWTRSGGGGGTGQMLYVHGISGYPPESVGSYKGANSGEQALVTFFGSGQIATYHADGSLTGLTGLHTSGFRDSFGDESDDTFTGDEYEDLINGLGGNDRLDGAGGGDWIQGGDGNDVLLGKAGDDRLEGELGTDKLVGGDGADKLEGMRGNDKLIGGSGNDTIIGGADNDRLAGLFGIDTLTGGIGNDKFALAPDKNDHDIITDFNTTDDSLEISAARFGGGLTPGLLKPSLFASNSTGLAADRNDRFIYNTTTGELFFDSNGSAAGGARLIATFAGGTGPAASDFEIV